MEIKSDFSLTECKILISLLSINRKEEQTITSICHAINIPRTHPYFTSVFKYLFETGIVVQTRAIGKAKMVKVNTGKLVDLIDEQTLINYFYSYFNQYHICAW